MKAVKILLFLVAVLFCFESYGSGSALAAGLPVGMIALTFDDGVYNSDMQQAFNKMLQHSIPGTLYVVTDWVGSGGTFTWANIKFFDDMGWEIGNHTGSHGHPLQMTASAFISQVNLAEIALRQHGIMQVNSFAIPYGEGYNLLKGLVVLNSSLLNGLNSLGYITTSRQAFTGDNATILNDVATFNSMAVKVFSCKGSTPESYIIGLIDQAILKKQLLVLVIHEIRQIPDASDNDQIRLDMFGRICDYIALHASQGQIVAETLSHSAGDMIFYK